jgi:hypothetical protein
VTTAACFRHQPHPDTVAEALGEELLLVQLGQGATYQLNRTGKFIWELAGAGFTMEQISQRLTAHFTVPLPQASQDVRSLLDELVHFDLLAESPS